MTNVFAANQSGYRFYEEDGAENASTALGAEDTALTRFVLVDSNVQLRIQVEESGAGNISGAATDDYQLQRSINGGAFANVTTTSTAVKVNTASALTDGGNTTARLAAGGGAFVAGRQDDQNGIADNMALTGNSYTEHVFGLTLVASELAQNDALTFRLLLNAAAFTAIAGGAYTVTPTLNANKVISGTASAGITATTASAAATFLALVTGDATATIAASVASASGDFTAGDVEVTGTAVAALAASTAAASGEETFTGTAAGTLASTTAAAAGVETFTGTAVASLSSVAGTVAGTFGPTGTAAATIAAVVAAATEGAQQPTGTAAATLAATTGTATASFGPTGNATATLATTLGAATGALAFVGNAAAIASAAIASSSGSFVPQPITGTVAATIASVTAEAAGIGPGPTIQPPTWRTVPRETRPRVTRVAARF